MPLPGDFYQAGACSRAVAKFGEADRVGMTGTSPLTPLLGVAWLSHALASIVEEGQGLSLSLLYDGRNSPGAYSLKYRHKVFAGL